VLKTADSSWKWLLNGIWIYIKEEVVKSQELTERSVKMTQIGTRQLQYVPHNRLLPVNMPSYLYDHPSINTFRVSTVKEGMFRPHLPTFRRFDMDNSTAKLSDEHSRTMTTCTRGQYTRKLTVYLVRVGLLGMVLSISISSWLYSD